MYPHRIRLRGPWECVPIVADGIAPEPRRVIMPARWADAGLLGFVGDARFTRKFGYPGRADPVTEHIWLTCEGVTGCREVRLNDHLLSEGEAGKAAKPSPTEFAFDVTPWMGQRNQLDVVIHGENESAGLWGEVALEIRRDAYLMNVRADRLESTLIIQGSVVGIAPQPLELYTLVDNHHVDYRTIVPNLAGQAFRIELPESEPSAQSVRVELIHISAVWYVVELPISYLHAR